MTTSVSDSGTSLLEKLETCSGTDIGRRREENQDALGVILGDSLHFYIVADGMGGVQGGAVASKLAIETFAEQFDGAIGADFNVEKIKEAIRESNRAIFKRGNEDTTLSGMGTTFVGVAVTADRMMLFNVGDSRAYRVRNSKVLQLTEDHTLVSDLIRSGAITPEQAENHPVSHMLTRSLGPAESVEPDCTVMDDGPAGGDIYLLCSDGLYNLVSDREILRILTQKEIEEAKNYLIQLANERGGTDNITVILLRIHDDYPVDASQFPESEQAIGFDESDTVELVIDVNGHIRNSKSGQEFEIPTVDSEDSDGSDEDSPVIEEGVSLSEVQLSTQKKLLERDGIHDEESASEILGDADAFDGRESVSADPTSHARESDSSDGEPTTRRRLSTGMLIVGGVVALFILVGLVFSGGSEVPGSDQTLSADQSTIESESRIVPDGLQESQAASQVMTQAEAEVETEVEQEQEPLLELDTPEPTTDNINEDPSEQADQLPDDEQPKLTVVEGEEELVAGTLPEGLGGLSFPEVQGIRARKESLQRNISLMKQRLEAFGAPYSGNLAEVLVATSRERQALEEKLAEIQSQIEETTRSLASWYSRQKQLKAGNKSMRLVEEIASSSEPVKKVKSEFENTTWEYLKQAEALRYSPTDVALQEKVKKLIANRKAKQIEMYEVAEQQLAEFIRENNEKILELNMQRDETKKSVQDLLGELDYLKVLMSGSEDERAKLKSALELELVRSQGALEELERILSD